MNTLRLICQILVETSALNNNLFFSSNRRGGEGKAGWGRGNVDY